MKRGISVLTAAALLIGVACMVGACSGKKDAAVGNGGVSKASVSTADGIAQADTKSGGKAILVSDTKGDLKETVKLWKQSSDMDAEHNSNPKAWTKAKNTQYTEILNKIAETIPTLNSAQVSELTMKNANQESDFEYDLNQAGDGIVIRKYTGKVQTVIVPATIEDYPVVEIGDNAFRGVTSVVLPDAIIKIGGGAFATGSLRAINFPAGLREIGDNSAFANSSLKSISLPAGLQKIGRSAFSGCSSLKEVVIPEGIEFIEGGVFDGCSNLISVTLPSSIKKIGWHSFSGAFSSCTNLTDVIIPDSVTAIEWMRYSVFSYKYYPQGSKDDEGYDVGDSPAFLGDGKLKLAVRKRLQDLGYKGSF
jgi:hypothetical protein